MAEWSFYMELAPRLGWERLSSMSLASLQMSRSMCPKAISRVYAVMVWFAFPYIYFFFTLSACFGKTGETFGVSMCHVIWNISANKDLFSFYTTTTFGLRLFLYHLSCFPSKSPSILSVELYWFVFALLGPHCCPCRVRRSREQSGGESSASMLAAAGHPAQHHHHLHHNRRGQQRARAGQSPHRH